MTDQEFKLEKAKAISQLVAGTAFDVIKTMNIAYPPKRAFKKIDRKKVRINRAKRKEAQLKAVLIPVFARTSLQTIIAQPNPDYPKGSSDTFSGPAFKVKLNN